MVEVKYPRAMEHDHRKSVMVRSPGEEQEYAAMGFRPVKPAEWSEYPKSLRHKDYAPAKMIKPESRGPLVVGNHHAAASARLFGYTPAEWEPERNPPVVANNAEEEARYLAQGYFAEGAPDSAAFAAAKAGAASTPQEVVLYPKWVTPPGGEAVVVKSEVEERQLLAKWSDAKKSGAPRQGARA